MTIKSKDRYEVLAHGHPSDAFYGIRDNDRGIYLGWSISEAHAEHIVHALNAMNSLISSVEALP